MNPSTNFVYSLKRKGLNPHELGAFDPNIILYEGGLTMKDKERLSTNISKNEEAEQPVEKTWATDAQDELEDWIEEQGIQLRY